MRALDPRKWLLDLMCIGLIVVVCVGVLAACIVVAIANQLSRLTRSLNPFSREVVIQ
jgi:hypothetical protein